MKNNLRRFCRKEKRLIQVKVFKHMLLHILLQNVKSTVKQRRKMCLFKMTDAITLFACLSILASTFRRMFWFSPFLETSPADSRRGSDRLHFFLEAYKMRLAPIGSSVASQLKEMWDQEIITRKPLDGYIYLHLPSTSTIHVGRYTGPMDPMGNPFGSFKYFWSNLTNIFQMGWSHQLDYIHSVKLTARQSPWKPCKKNGKGTYFGPIFSWAFTP